MEIPKHVTCVASNSAPVMAYSARHAFEKEVNRPRTRRPHEKGQDNGSQRTKNIVTSLITISTNSNKALCL